MIIGVSGMQLFLVCASSTITVRNYSLITQELLTNTHNSGLKASTHLLRLLNQWEKMIVLVWSKRIKLQEFVLYQELLHSLYFLMAFFVYLQREFHSVHVNMIQSCSCLKQ